MRDRDLLTIDGFDLKYDGETILTLRKDAHRQAAILKRFEEKGWPSRLSNPDFEGREDFHAEQKMWSHATMKLNKNMKKIWPGMDPEGVLRFGTRHLGSVLVCFSDIFELRGVDELATS